VVETPDAQLLKPLHFSFTQGNRRGFAADNLKFLHTATIHHQRFARFRDSNNACRGSGQSAGGE
jgi:hypothetical protein